VLVGDSQADIIAGRAAGMITLAITSGVAGEDLLSQEHPAAIINSLSELPSLIAGPS
jgi:pyrophosphatase PpaX